MCGFVACLGDSSIASAMARISHRGIRSSEMRNRWGSIGHVRLPIVGLGTEHDQPFEKHGWIAAFVGEILDFRVSHPEAQSDVEVLKDLWHPLGVRSLSDRDGFWAVAGIDPHVGALILISDYLAQKPTYYRLAPPSAASEIGPLLELGPTRFDEIYLSSCIKWGYCPDPQRTPYEEIKRVLPGERVHISQNGYVRRRTIDPLVPQSGSPEDLKSAIVEAVRLRVESSDVPVAALVSGGLDSAIAYVLAQRFGDVRAFHVENGEEEAASRVVAGRPRQPTIAIGDVTLEHALDYMEEPIDLGSLVPQVAISDAMGDQHSVCLTGDGADEFFGGYGRASRYDSQASDVWQELVAWHLSRLDRVMMRNRIEVRSPFLSRRVAGAALALDRQHRIDKIILRQLFEADLPRGIAWVPKRPLRTRQVEDDREGRSMELVRMLRERHAAQLRHW